MLQNTNLERTRHGMPRIVAATLLLTTTVFGCGGADDVAASEADAHRRPPVRSDQAGSSSAAQVAGAADPACDEVYELRAHAPSSDGPFVVSAGQEVHPQVRLDAPWGSEDVQAIKFVPITDNKKVLHHWNLYAGNALLTGWAPGDDDATIYPADVGVDLPRGAASLRLDMHYYNSAGASAESDRSGVAVCVVKGKNLRKNSAATMMGFSGMAATLAPAKKLGHQVTGNCTVRTTKPVTLITATPHAHRFAKHMKFTVKKANGTEIVMHDMPFTFGEQTTYPLDPPVTIETGDVVSTTCTYDNDTNKNITFGESTDNEMCFNFAIYYPKGALSCSFGGRAR